eukprot:Rhum_TRINITY_DN8547_c0_g1::Rhum_TRINITY_DN8547_c0_g1_i1::g.28361::m.28361
MDLVRTNGGAAAAAAAVAAGALGAAVWKSPEIYDFIVVKMTARWYEVVVDRLEKGDKVADIGIGTAGALVKNAAAVRAKDLTLVGVDYDAAYVKKAQEVVAANGLADNVTVHHLSVYDAALRTDHGTFDAVYFSGSFTLLPDPQEALQVATAITKPGGLIYITQTYQRSYVPLLGCVKPLLRYLISIDFGPLTYEAQLEEILAASGMAVLENEVIPNSVDNRWQAARLIVLKCPESS